MIALQVMSIDQHRVYPIRFSTEAQALAWWDAHPYTAEVRSNTYVIGEASELLDAKLVEPVDPYRLPELFDRLYPTCEHGMSGRICSGPNHFGEPGDDWAN